VWGQPSLGIAARGREHPCTQPFTDVNRQAILLARWAGRGAFKATALVFAFVIIVTLWLWNASLLTTAADENLRIVKTLTHLLPSDWVGSGLFVCVSNSRSQFDPCLGKADRSGCGLLARGA
jgi:hypothetical protein